MEEKLGIETLKEAALVGVKFGMKLEADLSDGKLSIGEIIGLGFSTAPDVWKLVPKASQIKEEYLDLDDQEREELVDYVVDELDLTSDKAEEGAEKIFDLLIQLEDVVRWATSLKGDE